jgi:potassium voltage-gated channel Shab-related subfamily B member 1
MFILISTMAATLNSLPSLQMHDRYGNITGDNVYLAHVETTCVCWFTFEYLARLWATPDR